MKAKTASSNSNKTSRSGALRSIGYAKWMLGVIEKSVKESKQKHEKIKVNDICANALIVHVVDALKRCNADFSKLTVTIVAGDKNVPC